MSKVLLIALSLFVTILCVARVVAIGERIGQAHQPISPVAPHPHFILGCMPNL
jgi:hypothetical protein